MIYTRWSCQWDLFFVETCMGVLVNGGDDSHSRRTPDLGVLIDMHSPDRLCQAWTKAARRAPTGASSPSIGRIRASGLLLGTEGPTSSLRSSGTRYWFGTTGIRTVILPSLVVFITDSLSNCHWFRSRLLLGFVSVLWDPNEANAGPTYRICSGQIVMLGPRRSLSWNGAGQAWSRGHHWVSGWMLLQVLI